MALLNGTRPTMLHKASHRSPTWITLKCLPQLPSLPPCSPFLLLLQLKTWNFITWMSVAFLNGDLDKEIYMSQPEGFVQLGQEHLVFHLKKSLYSLKQSPWQWYQKLHQMFTSIGFKHCATNNSLWTWVKDKVKVIVPVYVDDLTLACNNLSALTELKAKLYYNPVIIEVLSRT